MVYAGIRWYTLVYAWYTRGIRVVYARLFWYTRGTRAVYAWYLRAIRVVYAGIRSWPPSPKMVRTASGDPFNRKWKIFPNYLGHGSGQMQRGYELNIEPYISTVITDERWKIHLEHARQVFPVKTAGIVKIKYVFCYMSPHFSTYLASRKKWRKTLVL